MAKRRDRRGAETIKFAHGEAPARAQDLRAASLLVIQGAESDLGTHVMLDRPVTIGRDPDVELPLADGSISREHIRIDRAPDGRYLLSDLGSTNGTLVNGERVTAHILSEGDKIFLGASVVKFGYADGLDMDFHNKLEELVGTDALTGLLLKRKFDAELELALARALAAGEPIAVLVMDMDGLKQINDTHGHPYGGYAIAEVGAILRDVVGARGEACRFGGDEFMCYLKRHTRDAGLKVAEAIVDRVRTHHFEKDGVIIQPTISIGVAVCPDDGDSGDLLFEKADQALYRAKAAGRDRACI